MITREEYLKLVDNYVSVVRIAVKAAVRNEDTFANIRAAKQALIDFYDMATAPFIPEPKPYEDLYVGETLPEAIAPVEEPIVETEPTPEPVEEIPVIEPEPIVEPEPDTYTAPEANTYTKSKKKSYYR